VYVCCKVKEELSMYIAIFSHLAVNLAFGPLPSLLRTNTKSIERSQGVSMSLGRVIHLKLTSDSYNVLL
jgi:hypothetical protein